MAKSKQVTLVKAEASQLFHRYFNKWPVLVTKAFVKQSK